MKSNSLVLHTTSFPAELSPTGEKESLPFGGSVSVIHRTLRRTESGFFENSESVHLSLSKLPTEDFEIAVIGRVGMASICDVEVNSVRLNVVSSPEVGPMSILSQIVGVAFYDGQTTHLFVCPDFVREEMDRRHFRAMLRSAIDAWCFLVKEPLGLSELREMMGIRDPESEGERLFFEAVAEVSGEAKNTRSTALELHKQRSTP